MGVAQDGGLPLERHTVRASVEVQQDSIQHTTPVEHNRVPTRNGTSFSSVMKQTVMHMMALFIFLYVGVEVTIGGVWIRSR